MIRQNDKTLADVLVRTGVVTADNLAQYRQHAMDTSVSLQDYLIQNSIVDERQIMQAYAQCLNLETVDLRHLSIPPEVIAKVPVKFAWYYKFVPIKLDGNSVTLASAVPLDVKAKDEIRVHLGLEPKVAIATVTEVNEALKKFYGLASDTISQVLARDTGKKIQTSEGQSSWIEDIEKKSEDPSVAKVVNQIILEAYQKRATDIHLEPYRDKVRLRYRIDGVLVDGHLPPEARHLLQPILSRIKIMSNLSITERRLPQDGSAIVKTKDQDLDLRVSTIPTPHGESMVIRILPTKAMLLSLERLGFNNSNAEIFRRLIKKPHGIIFVTGPTGSGKTTTLYACLNEINAPERKIITIEDPVEYEMEGVTQIQVNVKVDLDFARGLRSVLRHDPDIIMVGEVRDLETAEIAIRTALTGHLVFSTLHTNDASSGVTRLINMGVEPYLVASSVEAFVAQRLVRVICPNCKEEDRSPLAEVKKEMGEALKLPFETIKIYKGRGCDKCNQTGFYGRTAIYEILIMDDDIKEAVLSKQRADYIKQLAMEKGMRTLRLDGWKTVLEGVTTPGEVMNVTVKDEPLKNRFNAVTAATVTPATGSPAGQAASPRPVSAVASKKTVGLVKSTLSSARNEYDTRTYPRASEALQLRFKIIEQNPDNPEEFLTDGVEYSTMTKDISAGGLRFVSGELIPMGTILEFKIYLEGADKGISCLARVCRVEEDNVANVFGIGAYYLDLASAERVQISKFVESRLKNNSPQG